MRLAAALCLVLAGCSSAPRMWAEDDIREIAREEQPDGVSAAELAATVARLEAEVERLGREQSKDITTLRDITAADLRNTNGINAEIERLDANDKAFHAQIDYLRALHNRPPMPTS